ALHVQPHRAPRREPRARALRVPRRPHRAPPRQLFVLALGGPGAGARGPALGLAAAPAMESAQGRRAGLARFPGPEGVAHEIRDIAAFLRTLDDGYRGR